MTPETVLQIAIVKYHGFPLNRNFLEVMEDWIGRTHHYLPQITRI